MSLGAKNKDALRVGHPAQHGYKSPRRCTKESTSRMTESRPAGIQRVLKKRLQGAEKCDRRSFSRLFPRRLAFAPGLQDRLELAPIAGSGWLTADPSSTQFALASSDFRGGDSRKVRIVHDPTGTQVSSNRALVIRHIGRTGLQGDA